MPDFPALKPSALSTTEEQTRFRDAISYNNFYEFGPDKGDPMRHAASLRVRPWTVAVEGKSISPGCSTSTS